MKKFIFAIFSQILPSGSKVSFFPCFILCEIPGIPDLPVICQNMQVFLFAATLLTPFTPFYPFPQFETKDSNVLQRFCYLLCAISPFHPLPPPPAYLRMKPCQSAVYYRTPPCAIFNPLSGNFSC